MIEKKTKIKDEIKKEQATATELSSSPISSVSSRDKQVIKKGVKSINPKKKIEGGIKEKKTEKGEKGEDKKKKTISKYFEAVGRRKTSTARVRLFTSAPLSSKDGEETVQVKKDILVNKKPYKSYFPDIAFQKEIEAPLRILNCSDKFTVSILVKGGGLSSQAGACRHGISRVLVLVNPYFRKKIKKAGFLTRDPRMRERKKFGLKRARKAPQWSKR